MLKISIRIEGYEVYKMKKEISVEGGVRCSLIKM